MCYTGRCKYELGCGQNVGECKLFRTDNKDYPYDAECMVVSRIMSKMQRKEQGTEMTLDQLQKEQKDWSDRNFPDQKPHQSLLGLIEEVGELSHAHLKTEQGIRVNEDHLAAKADAVGDIVIYLAGYCNHNGLNLEECVAETWEKVKMRDWNKNKNNGEVKNG